MAFPRTFVLASIERVFREGCKLRVARLRAFADLLSGAPAAALLARKRAAESIGRSRGDDCFLARIELLTARRLRPGQALSKAEAAGEATAL
jgi:hypothetical protein